MAAKLGRINGVSNTVTVQPGQSRGVVANCQDSEIVMGGGWRWINSDDSFVNVWAVESRRAITTPGWFVRGGNAGNAPRDLEVVVYCLEA